MSLLDSPLIEQNDILQPLGTFFKSTLTPLFWAFLQKKNLINLKVNHFFSLRMWRKRDSVSIFPVIDPVVAEWSFLETNWKNLKKAQSQPKIELSKRHEEGVRLQWSKVIEHVLWNFYEKFRIRRGDTDKAVQRAERNADANTGDWRW